MEVTNVFDNTKRLPYFESAKSSKIPNLCKPCPKYPEWLSLVRIQGTRREIAIALIVAAGYRVNQLAQVKHDRSGAPFHGNENS